MGKISNKSIVIKGAEMHNLKNIDLKIPKKKADCNNWTFWIW